MTVQPVAQEEARAVEPRLRGRDREPGRLRRFLVRHALDVAGDLPAATVRGIARAGTQARIVVVGACRAMIEEIYWALTPFERELVWFDTSWIWGPPEDDFAHLMRTVGAGRFVYGTGWPLRLTQTPRANLDLLPPELADAELTDASSIAPY